MDKIIGNRLNLFLLHNKSDNERELIKVKNNQELMKTVFEIKKKFGIPFGNYSEWIAIKELYNLIEKIPKNKTNYANRILSCMKTFRAVMSRLEANIPNEISHDLLYIIGVIIGDGSLPKNTTKKVYPVYICGTNEEYIKGSIKPLMKGLFDLDSKVKGRKRDGKSVLFEWYRCSKSLYRFLSNVFEIPIGKKSHIVKVPEIIKKLDLKKQLSFLSGLIDTDWGYEYYTFGSGCVSKQLLEDSREILKKLGIKNLKIRDRPNNAKNGSFSLCIPKNQILDFDGTVRKRLKNTEKLKILDNLKAPVV